MVDVRSGTQLNGAGGHDGCMKFDPMQMDLMRLDSTTSAITKPTYVLPNEADRLILVSCMSIWLLKLGFPGCRSVSISLTS
jgi:hypothetical protein